MIRRLLCRLGWHEWRNKYEEPDGLLTLHNGWMICANCNAGERFVKAVGNVTGKHLTYKHLIGADGVE